MSQAMLSEYDAGDTSIVDLSADGVSDRREVKEYADSLDTGGWEDVVVTEEKIWWNHPRKTSMKNARIERTNHGWSGYRRDRSVGPSNEDDLQTAIDRMAEWLRENPVGGEADAK